MKDLDINNFVDSILSGKKITPPGVKQSISEEKVSNYDIEHIELPESFVKYIIEGKKADSTLQEEVRKEFNLFGKGKKFGDIEKPKNTKIFPKMDKEVKKGKDRPEIKETVESKAQRLVKELADILSKAKSVVQEMTTCGMIGTTTAAPDLFSKKKKGQAILKDKKKWKSQN